MRDFSFFVMPAPVRASGIFQTPALGGGDNGAFVKHLLFGKSLPNNQA